MNKKTAVDKSPIIVILYIRQLNWGVEGVMVYDPDKISEMLWKYFPNVQFNRLKKSDKIGNKYCIEEIRDILDGYIDVTVTNKYYLRIPSMAKKDIFKPLFPDSRLINANELNEIRKSGKRPDIIKFFLEKEDKEFAESLNTHLVADDQIVPGKTILENFYKKYRKNDKNKKEFVCYYSLVTDDNGELSDEFVWEFSGFGFVHSDISSIYKAFRYYAHKNCFLYQLGVEFVKFKNCPANQPTVPGTGGQPLPNYLSHIKISLKDINADDFVWRNGVWKNDVWMFSVWTKINTIKHLLKKFGLTIPGITSLEKVYYSFCVPFLPIKSFSALSNKDRFITFTELGDDIIKNTVLRRTDLAAKQIVQKKKKIGKKQRDEFLDDFHGVWLKIIYTILESIPKEIINRYIPLDFLTFIKRISGYASYKEINIVKAKQDAVEQDNLTEKDRKKIRDIFNKIIGNVPIKEQEEMCKDLVYKEYRDLLEKIDSWISLENNRTLFPKENKIIESLRLKVTTGPIIHRIVTKNGVSWTDENIGDLKEPTPEIKFENKERKKIIKEIIIKCFENEFDRAGEDKWVQFIREEDAVTLRKYLQEYKPTSTGRLDNAINSDFFKLYLEIMGKSSISKKCKGKEHTRFQTIVRETSNILEKEGHWRIIT
jgi:hypothetical protein